MGDGKVNVGQIAMRLYSLHKRCTSNGTSPHLMTRENIKRRSLEKLNKGQVFMLPLVNVNSFNCMVVGDINIQFNGTIYVIPIKSSAAMKLGSESTELL